MARGRVRFEAVGRDRPAADGAPAVLFMVDSPERGGDPAAFGTVAAGGFPRHDPILRGVHAAEIAPVMAIRGHDGTDPVVLGRKSPDLGPAPGWQIAEADEFPSARRDGAP